MKRICDVCGKKAKLQIAYTHPIEHSYVQKFFYCCGKEKCMCRLRQYAKERNENFKVYRKLNGEKNEKN